MKVYQQLIEAGEYQEAIEGLNEVIAQDAYHTEALVWLAKAQFKLEQFEVSIETYNKVINLMPNNADLYADRGLCYHLNTEQKMALEDFNKAVELEPTNAYRYSCRAFVKDYYKDFKGALTDYNKAIELDPKDAIAYNNKGVLEEKLGFADQAKESFNQSNELQGIDLEKELAKINISDSPQIILPTKPSIKLSFKGYLKIIKSVFTTKEGFIEFYNFMKGKNKPNN